MSKNPAKQWDRCLYCDASIKGDDALVAELHDPYCPHGKALVRLTRELDEAKKENERLRHPSCVPYAGAEVVCKERDALRTQVAELKSRLAEAKRENERLTIERNYWYGATAAAIEQKKALGPLPAAPNEATGQDS